MRSRIVIGFVGGSVLLIGLALSGSLGGRMPAMASGGSTSATASTDYQKYCQLYVQSLASALKVSVAQLEAANLSAMEKTIRQAYADGKITQAQETKLLDKATRFGKDPCAALHRAHAAASHPRVGSVRHTIAYAVVSDRTFPLGIPYAASST